MANKQSFTPEEWTKVMESAMMAGVAVTAAEPSGLWGKIVSAAKWIAEKLKAAFKFIAQLLTDPGFWVSLIVANYLFKVAIEVLLTPVTYKVTSFLKKAEHEDFYDKGTNFSPFAL